MQIKYFFADNIDELRGQWEKLERGADMTIFQSYRWNQLLLREFHAYKYNQMFSHIEFVVAFEGSEVLMIAPVIIQKFSLKLSWLGRRKGIYILGYNSYSDYLNFVYNEFISDAYEQIIKDIKDKYSCLPIYMFNLREHTAMCEYLSNNNYRIDHVSTAVYVSILDTIEEYNNILSKSVRQNLRTAQNRIKKAGINYELVIKERLSDNVEDTKLAEQLLELHQKRVAIKNNKNDIKGLRRLSRVLMYAYFNRKELKFSIIKISMKMMDEAIIVMSVFDNKVVGYLFGLRDGNSIRILQNCFDEDYKFYSPMFRGAYDFICVLCEESEIQEVDFTRGDEEYKYKLGGKEITLKYFTV